MRETTTVRYCPEPTVEEAAATLLRVAEGRFQAQCDCCFRSSPVVAGAPDELLPPLDELGWIVAIGGSWMCPLCAGRRSGRYTVA